MAGGARTGCQVGQAVPEDGKEVNAGRLPGGIVGIHLHDGRDGVVEGNDGGGAGRADAAVVVEGLGGAGPEGVADGAGGQGGAEVPLDQDFSCWGQDEQRLDHG